MESRNLRTLIADEYPGYQLYRIELIVSQASVSLGTISNHARRLALSSFHRLIIDRLLPWMRFRFIFDHFS